MNDKNNVKSPIRFQEKLQDIMEGIYELLELSKENDLAPVSEDGVTRYIGEDGKTCFQVSGQFDRPTEFLESLLDIIRVNYEPCVLGTFFLNSNIEFLYEGMPDSSFQLGYISITSEAGKDFCRFWEEDVTPHIVKCGYSIKDATAIYAVASTGIEKYGFDLIEGVLEMLNSGFSVDEATCLLASSVCEEVDAPFKRIHSGFCLDSALEDKTRLSLWLFMNHNENAIQ